jgi:hypothetical protein
MLAATLLGGRPLLGSSCPEAQALQLKPYDKPAAATNPAKSKKKMRLIRPPCSDAGAAKPQGSHDTYLYVFIST